MSSAVVSPEAPAADARAAARARTRVATPPEWLWPVSLALQVASAAALTAYTYFFLDDWFFIAQARRVPFGIHYLRMGLFEHFSPISRALDKLLVYNSTGNFALAHALELIMYAAAIAAFAFVVRTILGNRWSAFALTILFGQSLFVLRLLNWWTATANILPSTIFGLLAFGAYLRWERSRSRGWLSVALAAFLLSVLDYETAMLLPLLIAVVRLLVLEDRLNPRAWVRVLRSEWVMWAGLFVIDAAALVNFYAFYYQPAARPTLSSLLDFLVDSVLGTFIPAMFAIKHPQAWLGRQAVVGVVCVIAALALAAYAVYERPRAWRCVVAFFLSALVVMLPLGLSRIAKWGVFPVATELYYQQPLQFMLLILAAFALRLAPRRVAPARPVWVRSPVAAVGLSAAALAAYGVLFVTSLHAMNRPLPGSVWDPHRSLEFVHTFQASVRSTTARTGREPVLFNAQVPDEVFGKYDSYAIFFPMIDSHVRVGAVASPIYAVRESGALTPISFHARVAGVLARATVLESGASASPALMRSGSACTPVGPGTVRLRIPLAHPTRLLWSHAMQIGKALPLALRLSVRMPSRASVPVAAHGWWSWWEKQDLAFPPTFPAGASGQYVPLDVRGRALAIDLRLPAGACVSSLALGAFTPRTLRP